MPAITKEKHAKISEQWFMDVKQHTVWLNI
jgi:hypothetical protein